MTTSSRQSETEQRRGLVGWCCLWLFVLHASVSNRHNKCRVYHNLSRSLKTLDGVSTDAVAMLSVAP